MAAVRCGADEKVKVLLQYGANIHAVNEKGETALALAKKLSDASLVALLEAREAQVTEGTA